MPNTRSTNTWPAPHDPSYNYYSIQQTPSTTESSPISSHQFTDWFSSPVETSYYSDPPAPPPDSIARIEETEEPQPEAGHDHNDGCKQEPKDRGGKRGHESSDTDEPEMPTRKRRRGGEDGKKIRNSRACIVCRGFKAKCMPGPSLRDPDEESPCMRCTTSGQECVFKASRRGKYPTKKFARLQKQLEHMERTVRLLDEAIKNRSRSRYYLTPSRPASF